MLAFIESLIENSLEIDVGRENWLVQLKLQSSGVT